MEGALPTELQQLTDLFTFNIQNTSLSGNIDELYCINQSQETIKNGFQRIGTDCLKDGVICDT